MTRLSLILSAVLLAVTIATVQCKTFPVRGSSNFVGKECTLSSYAPGGKEVAVSKITAPTAKLEQNAISKIMGIASKSSTLAMHSVNAVSKFTNVFSKVAPKLGPMLGVFGAAFGMITALTKPTPNDILNACNQAIGKLTKEVNDRLENMKGYVDAAIMDLERDIIKREYKTMFNSFSDCVHEITKEDVYTCMKNANRLGKSSFPKLAVFNEEIENWPDKPDTVKVKRLETNLVSFRDYALLRILTLKTLVDTYKDDSTTENAEEYYQKYEAELKTSAAKFVKYARSAVKVIVKAHTYRDSCKESVNCGAITEVKEGWLAPVHTADRITCGCYLDRMLENNKASECQLKLTMRADGKEPTEYIKYNINKNSNKDAAPLITAQIMQKQKTDRYITDIRKAVENFWTGSVLSVAYFWEKIANGDTDFTMPTPAPTPRRKTQKELMDELFAGKYPHQGGSGFRGGYPGSGFRGGYPGSGFPGRYPGFGSPGEGFGSYPGRNRIYDSSQD